MSLPRYSEFKESGVEWLGEVPADWDVQRLSWLFGLISSGTTPPSEIARYYDGDICWVTTGELREGIISDTEKKVTQDALRELSALRVYPVGTLLIALYGATIGRLGVLGVEACTNQACCALANSLGTSPRFVFYALLAAKEYLLLIASGGGQPNINQDKVRSLRIGVPSVDEQEAIANFLDRETSVIDSLIAEQEKLIALLKEKRQAVISHAVTKGLDHNVPMKDSGIEWLGEVPAHWEVVPLIRITLDKCDGPFGSGLKSEHYSESGVRVIRLQNIRRDGFDGADAAFIDEQYYQLLPGHDVVCGDVLVAGLGDDNNTLGRACVAPPGIEPAMVKADCFRFRLDTQVSLPAFIAVQLTAGSEADAGVLATGTTRSRIPLSLMATRRVALPPLSEQREIYEYLYDQALLTDSLLKEAVSGIALLKERRSALISSAVTGKIDVRQYRTSDIESTQTQGARVSP